MYHKLKFLMHGSVAAYSWLDQNSQGMTHEVKSNPKKVIISGVEYSDFIGNVTVWAQDNFAFGRPQFEQDTNPVTRIPNAGRSVIWGASFESNADSIRLGERWSHHMNVGSKTLGLRVVRSLTDVRSDIYLLSGRRRQTVFGDGGR